MDSRQVKWILQVNVLHNNFNQNITSLSLLVGTTVLRIISYYYFWFSVSLRPEFFY